MLPTLTSRRLLDVTGFVEVDATLLGEATSFAQGKTRWFEVSIYLANDGAYVVHTVGRSTREGERDFGRVVRTRSPLEVVEVLTVRRKSQRHSHDGDRNVEPYIPVASARAMAQAAGLDEGMRRAYVELVA